MRLFVAIELPDEVRAVVSAGLCYGLPDVRWAPAEQMHVTLRFIGDLPESSGLDEIQDALAGITAPAFALRLRGVGVFAGGSGPQIVWVGLEEQPALFALQRRVEFELRAVHVPAERRPFRPHVTLARARSLVPARLDEYLRLHADFVTPEFTVDEFVLFSSERRPEHALHHALAGYPLTR